MKFSIVVCQLIVGFGLSPKPLYPTLLKHENVVLPPSKLKRETKVLLETGNHTTATPQIVRHQKIAGDGYAPGSPYYDKQQGKSGGPKADTKKLDLPISTTVKCILNLTIQFFIIYTALFIARTLNSKKVREVCENAKISVDYAPMLCVLFLGTRMRAIQLTQGDTEKYELPQPWVQNAMQVASFAVLAQALVIIAETLFKGDPPREDSPPREYSRGSVAVFEIVNYVTMLALYGGFITVVVGAVWMPVPKPVWGDKEPPVSPAVANTINLGAQYFIVNLFLRIFITKAELAEVKTTKEINIFRFASDTVKVAPMLCIMFLAVRQRALAMDPKNGNPQSWAQKGMYVCSYSVLAQTLIVIVVPFLFYGDCKMVSVVEGDVQFVDLNPTVSKALTVLRWVLMLALYGGFTVVAVSPFILEKEDGSPAPPLSPALGNVLNLVGQFFFVHLFMWIARTYHQESKSGGGLKAVQIFDAAKSTCQFCPMLAILFVAARMRAQQVGQIMDFKGAPQGYAQDAMHLATWSLLVQLLMVILVGVVSETVETDEDGNVKVAGTSIFHKILEGMRYVCLAALYGGVIVILYAIFTIDAELANPKNASQLIPGVAVPSVSDISQQANAAVAAQTS